MAEDVHLIRVICRPECGDQIADKLRVEDGRVKWKRD